MSYNPDYQSLIEGDILDITIAKDVKATEYTKERVSSLLEKFKSKSIETK